MEERVGGQSGDRDQGGVRAAPRPGDDAAFLAGGGDMGARIRAHDWSTTAVGPVERWPQSLRTAVSILLTSGYPMYIAWGPEFVQFYNDAYRPILGASKHPAALGQTTPECFAEIWDIIGPMFCRVTGEGVAVTYSDFLLPMDRNGYVEECYFDYSYSPIRDESGGVGGVFVTCSETTGRVLGARRLASLRELGVSAAAARTVVVACSEAIEVLSGNPHDLPFAVVYSAAGGVFTPVAMTRTEGPSAEPSGIARRLRDPATWPLERLLAGEPMVVVDDLLDRAGEIELPPWPEPVRAAVALPIRPGGSGTGLEAALVVGLTPRHAFDDDYRGFIELVAGQLSSSVANAMAHQEATQRTEALAQLDRAKTTFFSNISHEFRTPLTLSLAPLEDVLSESEAAESPTLRDQDRERLQTVHRNSLRLLRLVNSLLDFSRIEAGRIQADVEPVDLGALTTGLASLFRSVAERAGLTLVVECQSRATPVLVDPEMWERIVLNLVSNAIKYTFEGSVAVTLAWEDDVAVLTVSDTGVGIPEGELENIFERFHRVAGVRARTAEGTGIGLALVRELVSLHGGVIGVSSAIGQGTTVTVRLPATPARQPGSTETLPPSPGPTAVAAALVDEALRWLPGAETEVTHRVAALDGLGLAQPATNPGGEDDLRGARILVADDNADMLGFIARLLDGSYRVDTARDGVEALERARETRPDLVVADVMMPRLDGFGLLRALREDEATATTPVILLSARAGDEATVEGLDAGADDYLVKPFSTRELLARVRGILQLSRARGEAATAAAKYAAAATALGRAVRVLKVISGHIASTDDLSAFFADLTAAVGELVQARRAAFWQVDAEHEVLSIQPGAFGFPDEILGQLRDLPCRPLAGELADRVVYEDLVLGPSNIADDEFAPYRQWLGLMGVRDVVAGAWRAGDQPLGLLAAYDSLREGGFEDEDTWVLRIAGLAAGLVWQYKQAEAALDEVRRSEAALLRDEVDRMAHLERLKSDFLRLASHELRGPLGVLRGYLEMLEAGDLGPVPPEVAATYRVLATSVDGMARLVESMLETARLDDRRLVLDAGGHDLRSLVAEAVDSQRTALTDGHRLDVTVCEEPLPILGDALRLRALVANLVSNAIKYSPDGGRIGVRCAAGPSDTATVVITDEGMGIAEENLGRVFTRFGRVVTTQNSHIPGTGLGLYLAREIARLHGGDVALVSRLGKGSALTVTLPLRHPPVGQPPMAGGR